MDASYWRDRWAQNQIAFHESKVNPLLVEYFDQLSLPAAGRIFVPLCGKTIDIHWLRSRGQRVAGAELSELAVQQLFMELGVTPDCVVSGRLTRYSAPGIDIFQGDIFDLARADLGAVDGVYDRGALVALPQPLRRRYATHLAAITKQASQLLVSITYEQGRSTGPPFSVTGDEIARLYEGAYRPQLLGSAPVPGGLKGKCPASDDTWLLTPIRA